MTPLIKLERYSHGVRLSKFSRELYDKLTIFLDGLALKEPRKLPHGGMVMELKKRFFGVTENKREIFIHRHHLLELLSFLRNRGVPEERIEQHDIPVPASLPAQFALLDHIELRDYQLKILDHLTNDSHTNGLYLYTGGGKSLTTLAAAAAIAKRTVIMVPPKYFGLWGKSLREGLKDIEGRYVTVSGSAELQTLIERGLEDELPYDVIIISMVTYRAYIESYEKFGEAITELGYPVPPTRFHEAIGAGLQINDEIQEDPGLVFRIDIFTNVAKQIYLSATPFTGSDYVTRMINVMIPPECECPVPAMEAYINVVGLLYNDNVQPKDYLMPFKNTYNHGRYETRLMKHPKRLARYLAMVRKLVQGLYARDRIAPQKMLILCYTVDFIKLLGDYLQKEFPELSVGPYVQGVPYANLLKQDITISTIKSAGTGVDIANLREVLLLQATDSKKDNIQILGRLRHMKDFPGIPPRFTYMACMDIPQHMRYHTSKKEHFRGRILNHQLMRV